MCAVKGERECGREGDSVWERGRAECVVEEEMERVVEGERECMRGREGERERASGRGGASFGSG